jgi:hypothetical protein
MLTKRVLQVYSYICQISLYYMFFIASIFDWDFKKKRLIATKGLPFYLSCLAFLGCGLAFTLVSLRMLIRIFWKEYLDPMAISVTLVYIIGLGTVSLNLLDLTAERHHLVESSRQIIRLDKQLQRKYRFSW